MNDPDKRRPAHLELLAVSWNFGWPVAAGVVIGSWIDDRLGTSPVVTLVLALGAMLASVRRLIELSRRDEAERRAARDDDEERPR